MYIYDSISAQRSQVSSFEPKINRRIILYSAKLDFRAKTQFCSLIMQIMLIISLNMQDTVSLYSSLNSTGKNTQKPTKKPLTSPLHESFKGSATIISIPIEYSRIAINPIFLIFKWWGLFQRYNITFGAKILVFTVLTVCQVCGFQF